METSAVLASVQDRVVSDTVAALDGHGRADAGPAGPQQLRSDVRYLFELVQRCVAEGSAEPIITPSQQIAVDRFAYGLGLAEAQRAYSVLAEVLWRHAGAALAEEQRVEALRQLTAVLAAGKDALAQTYVTLVSRGSGPPGPPAPPGLAADGGRPDPAGGGRADPADGGRPDPADGGRADPADGGRPDPAGAAALTGGLPDTPVQVEMRGPVGIITLDDQRRRNVIGAALAAGVTEGLASLQAQRMRVVVLRAAPGMGVWSAGHDINELPQGRRDPLGYNDHLEGLLRAIRTFPAPVIAMVHGTVWGGALDLVLSSDMVIADETASFAITAANLGLPYNTTGLLHFLGRLPINLIKEMFFTAAPIDALTARRWLLVNHLVDSVDLEAFTFEVAERIATKSPMAMAVIKEQLRVLSDYQPIAAQVYERIQGLRREAYDSSDYLEGLRAFAERRPPVFRGT